MTPSLDALRPASIAQFLGHGVGPGLVKHWLDEQRLRQRLEALLEERLGSLNSVTPLQHQLLELDSSMLLCLARRLGLLWHGDELRRIIDAPTRHQLLAKIGESDYRWLMGYAIDPPRHSRQATIDIATLDFAAQGASLLTAWGNSQATPFRHRLALLIDAVEPAKADTAMIGALLERLAVSLERVA